MILIDNRTGSKELAPYIRAPHLICRLEYADFAFPGNGPEGPVSIGVERKALHDFLSSMTSGRLSGHQIIGMARDYDESYIIIEGVWRPDQKNGMIVKPSGKSWRPVSHGSRRFMARELWSFCHTLSVCCGIRIVQTSNQAETGAWLTSAFRWWNRAWDSHKSHQQWVKPVRSAKLRKPNLATRIFSQLNGIGWDKATKLGREFPTPEFIMRASSNDFQEIDGIGPKLGDRMWDELHEEE